jgi:hypothetical protein
MNREGLLRAAEARSQELMRQAEEQARNVVRLAEEHSTHLKVDADNYVTETLRNLKDHLSSIEMDVSRSILSIEKGLESLELPTDEDGSAEEVEEEFYEDVVELDGTAASPSAPASHPAPRRASLANDTMGGPVF